MQAFLCSGKIKDFNAKHARCDLLGSECIKTSFPNCQEMHGEVYFGSPQFWLQIKNHWCSGRFGGLLCDTDCSENGQISAPIRTVSPAIRLSTWSLYRRCNSNCSMFVSQSLVPDFGNYKPRHPVTRLLRYLMPIKQTYLLILTMARQTSTS